MQEKILIIHDKNGSSCKNKFLIKKEYVELGFLLRGNEIYGHMIVLYCNKRKLMI